MLRREWPSRAKAIEPSIDDLVAIGAVRRDIDCAHWELLHRWGPKRALKHLKRAVPALEAAIKQLEGKR